MQKPLRVWQGFSNLSEVGPIYSGAEEEERETVKVCSVNVECEKE
jgi:hypothetical protein